MNNLRSQVLASFKKLHRTRKNVFKGDEHALQSIRQHINNGYLARKNETDRETILNLIKQADEVEEVIRKTVIQAVKTEGENYKVVMRDDIQLLDTGHPYRPMPDHMIGPFKDKKGVCPEEK